MSDLIGPGPVHVVGIGGMHMSAIAQLLHERGLTVRGSDLERSALTERLKAMGVTVYPQHAAEHLGDAKAVVATAAAGDENPEIAEARRRGLPILGRPEVVAHLMSGKRAIAVAGSHGKTTTSSLIAFILTRAGLDPMYLIGGESRDLGGNAAWGRGAACVVEADEYKRAFHAYRPDVSVITNVEADHLDYYGTAEAYAEAFRVFASQTAPDGRLLACSDDAGAATVADAAEAEGVQVERYGLGPANVWRGSITSADDDGIAFAVAHEGKALGELRLRVPGEHIARNALAAAAVCLGEGVDFPTIRDAAADFEGAKRRFEAIGEANGILVVDDYAHHPAEVRATLAAARKRFPERRLIGVYQPHTYSRIAYLWEDWLDCWTGLDALVVLETYAAREAPEAGRSAADLAKAIRQPEARYAADFDAAAGAAVALADPGDVIFTIGAGSVTEVGPRILERLR